LCDATSDYTFEIQGATKTYHGRANVLGGAKFTNNKI